MANNLTQYDPFGDLARIDPFRMMDELIREGRPSYSLRELAGQPQLIRLDVQETDDAYKVRAEMPGLKKEDIKVDVQGNRVTITAESKREIDQAEGALLRSERYYGAMTRSFTLSSEIDDTKAEARYNDGILELTLPKKADSGVHKLAIH